MAAAASRSPTPAGTLDQARGGYRSVLGVASQRHGVSNAIPDCNFADLGADRRNHSGGFLSQHKRQRYRVAAFAVVDINKVDACRLDLYDGFVRFRLRNRQVHQFHYFRTTGLLYLNRFHGSPLCSRPSRSLVVSRWSFVGPFMIPTSRTHERRPSLATPKPPAVISAAGSRSNRFLGPIVELTQRNLG